MLRINLMQLSLLSYSQSSQKAMEFNICLYYTLIKKLRMQFLKFSDSAANYTPETLINKKIRKIEEAIIDLSKLYPKKNSIFQIKKNQFSPILVIMPPAETIKYEINTLSVTYKRYIKLTKRKSYFLSKMLLENKLCKAFRIVCKLTVMKTAIQYKRRKMKAYINLWSVQCFYLKNNEVKKMRYKCLCKYTNLIKSILDRKIKNLYFLFILNSTEYESTNRLYKVKIIEKGLLILNTINNRNSQRIKLRKYFNKWCAINYSSQKQIDSMERDLELRKIFVALKSKLKENYSLSFDSICELSTIKRKKVNFDIMFLNVIFCYYREQ